MIVKTTNKYAPLEALSFGNRSDAERRRATTRPTVPDDAVEHKLLWGSRIELESDDVTPDFERDVEVITTNPVYRRLSDMGQLAPSFSHIFQNRMSHTNHVARVSGKLCKAMHLDADSTTLADAIARAHDIGHAPFSHEAEKVFNEKLKLVGGEWDHDYYGMRILTDRGQALLNSEGLPLTAAVLEGTLKRFRRFTEEPIEGGDIYHVPLSKVPTTIKDLEAEQELFQLEKWNHVEGQIVSTSDWIAGTCSDFRDLLLWELEQSKGDMSQFPEHAAAVVQHLPLAQDKWNELQALIPDEKKTDVYMQHKAIRIFAKMLEKELITDVLNHTLASYQSHETTITHAEDIRELDNLLVTFSPEIFQQMTALKKAHSKILYPNILKEHIDTEEMMREFYDVAKESFEGEGGLEIAGDWKKFYDEISAENSTRATERGKTHIIIDYIASGFTDKDVMHLMQKHKPEIYEALTSGAKEGVYPMHMPPPTTVWSKILNLVNNLAGTPERG